MNCAMWNELTFLAVIVGFFALLLAFVLACEKM
jgi:hypothetical protein